jgi:hypothetical protein
MRGRAMRGERKVSRGSTPKRAKDERSRYAGSPPKGLRPAFPGFPWRTRYALEPSSSPASTYSTSARSSSSGNAASFSRAAYNRCSCASDIDSRSTPPTRSSARGRCNQRSRISAARGSETARSRKPARFLRRREAHACRALHRSESDAVIVGVGGRGRLRLGSARVGRCVSGFR